MGLFSESHAYVSAKMLEKILKDGIKTKNEEIISFLKENVYPLYEVELGEIFGAYKEDREVVKIYGKNNSRK